MIAYYNQKSNLVFDNNFPMGSVVYDPTAEKIGIVIDETGVKYFGEETTVEPNNTEEVVEEVEEIISEPEEEIVEEEIPEE